MSYLSPLRLHFAGTFQANVSTVNNDPAHFDNAAFQPSYQLMQGPNMDPPNGWFNPQGDGTWRLRGCTVTSAWLPSGQVTSDSVLQCIVADSDMQAPGKLVDLDPEQQLVSEIWGMQVRIADSNGNTLMRGDFEPAAFIDIWNRATGQGSDIAAGAMYQSVLTNLWWGDVSGSTFLTKLQTAASSGLLSIKFNVDRINLDFTSADFMCGRVVGTIGPATQSEPQHMVLGRQFMAADINPGGFFVPRHGINFFAAVVDAGANCIFLDLGNAISTDAVSGQLNDLGDLALTVAGTSTPLGTIPSSGSSGYASNPTWYASTAGVVALPLSAAQLDAIKGAALTLASSSSSISEWPNGAFVRADRFVYRMSPNDSIAIPVYATQWGQPLAGVSVSLVKDNSQLQLQADPDVGVATPGGVLSFVTPVTTDANGVATFTVGAGDPGSPRLFNKTDYGIDGQVYGFRPDFADTSFDTGPKNPANFISFLVWSGFTAPSSVTWQDVQEIFQQYANLYPVMSRFLQLGNFQSVQAHASLLSLAFGLDPTNPNYMPVTRDLSPAKRNAILSFLANPVEGTAEARPVALAAEAPPLVPARLALKGGKAAAMARRLVVRNDAKGAAK